nr:GspH/FimT family protein [Vibrio maerlii]
MMVNTKMQRIVPEVHGFLLAARSEAVLRNSSLYAHFIVPSQSGARQNSTGEWLLVLTDDQSYDADDTILLLNGSPFDGINVALNFSNQTKIKVEGVRGRLANGNIEFHPVGNNAHWLQIKAANISGRVRICSADPDPNARNTVGFYNYALC